MLPALLGKLIGGGEIGPATAIGQDYRVLEVNRVVKLRPDATYPNRFFMKLLKKEVGELALHVLTQGNASFLSNLQMRTLRTWTCGYTKGRLGRLGGCKYATSNTNSAPRP
jgi:hypothetical protein